MTVVFVVLALLVTSCDSASKEKPEPEPVAKTIPLKSIYSTNGQEGLIPVKRREKDPSKAHLEAIRQEVRGGASNILLVNGDDIVQAVNATRWAFTGGRSLEVPVRPEPGDGPKPASFWMVAFLGIDGSTPPAWLVRSAERKGQNIRLSVIKPKRNSSTKDERHYFVWVPLGKLEAGRYTLELFDTETKELTLMRRVIVAAK